MSLMGFDTESRMLVPVCATVSHPSARVIRVEAAEGFTIAVFTGQPRHVAVSDGEDTFKIALKTHDGPLRVVFVAERIVEVHYE